MCLLICILCTRVPASSSPGEVRNAYQDNLFSEGDKLRQGICRSIIFIAIAAQYIYTWVTVNLKRNVSGRKY